MNKQLIKESYRNPPAPCKDRVQMGAGVTRNLYLFTRACLGNLSMVTKGELFLQNNTPGRERAAACVPKERALNESLAQTQQVSHDKDADRDFCQRTCLSWLAFEFKLYHTQTKNSQISKIFSQVHPGKKQSS